MANRTDIVNMALANIGRDPTQDALDDAKDLNLVNIQYDTALGDILRSHPWGFARRRAALPEYAGPVVGGRYAYMYPADCAMALKLSVPAAEPAAPAWTPPGRTAFRTAPGRSAFRVGRGPGPDGPKLILAATPPPAELEYTSDATDPALFDPSFATALSWRLAAGIALGILHDPEAHQAATQTYLAALASARAHDAAEGARGVFPDGAFVAARNW